MSDFSKQAIEELQTLVADKQEALRVFRFGGAGSRTRNVREGRNLRREIAQILTELRSRELVPIKKLGSEVKELLKTTKTLQAKSKIRKLASNKKSA